MISSSLDLVMALFVSGGKLDSSETWKGDLKFRFLEGIEVAKREVCNDIAQEEIGSAVEKMEEKTERRVAAPNQAAVVSVLCLRSSLFLVQVNSGDGGFLLQW